jgi:hypothetical protein
MLALIWIGLATTDAHAQEVDRVMTVGGTEVVYAEDMALDDADNLFLTGTFGGETDFGSTTLTATPTGDVYLAKYDPEGNNLWVQAISGMAEQEVSALAVDHDGNGYLTGVFYSSATFIGTETYTNTDHFGDAYIAKYGPQGDFIWAKQLSGDGGHAVGEDIVVDDNGNVYAIGIFNGTVDVDSETITTTGEYDSYVAKYDSNGNLLWVHHIQGFYADPNHDQRVVAVAEDDGRIYVAAVYEGSISFSGGVGSSASQGGQDIAVAAYAGDGTVLWVGSNGGSGEDAVQDMTVDNDGNVLFTGSFYGPADFGPLSVTSIGPRDGFVAKFTADGAPLWVQPFGGDGQDTWGRTLTTDSNDNIYIGGQLQGNAFFGELEIAGDGGSSFLVRYGEQGNATWVRRFTSSVYISTHALALTSNGRLYTAGSYQSNAHLGSFTIIVNQFYQEAYVARWGPPQDDLIFSDRFDLPNFSNWTNYSGDHGDLSAVQSPAFPGVRELQAVLDDNTPIGVRDEVPASEPRYLVRFHFHPHDVSMAQGENHVIFFGYSGQDLRRPVLRLELRRHQDGFLYQLRAALFDDGTTWRTTGWRTIGNEATRIALEWYAATGEGANDGRLHLRVNDRILAVITGVYNDTRRIDTIRLGAIAGIDDNTRGTYYFDDFESRRLTYIEPDQLVTTALTDEVTAWTEVDESDPAEAALMQEVLEFAEQVEREEAHEQTPPTEEEQSPQLFLPFVNNE